MNFKSLHNPRHKIEKFQIDPTCENCDLYMRYDTDIFNVLLKLINALYKSIRIHSGPDIETMRVTFFTKWC